MYRSLAAVEQEACDSAVTADDLNAVDYAVPAMWYTIGSVTGMTTAQNQTSSQTTRSYSRKNRRYVTKSILFACSCSRQRD